ncbi:MAG: RnfABCDGE type electron transport complex subunit D [Gammaproteobacteria bacterium]
MTGNVQLHDGGSVAGLMRTVLIALVPAAVAAVAYRGVGAAVQIALAVLAALAAEALALRLRGVPVRPVLSDGSVLLTAVLLALALPPAGPWWLAPVGTAFAVLLVKHAFGGLGANLFNPAMAGVALLLAVFPAQMSRWPASPPQAGTQLAAVFGTDGVDAVSGATALAQARTALRGMRMLSELEPAQAWGRIGAAGEEWVNLAFLIGGLWLLWRRAIGWRIPAGVLVAIAVPAALAHGADPDRFLPAMFHLFSGATMAAAFFIATDPVTAPSTPRGMLVFGAGVGALIWSLRTWGAHPDGVAFAVLAMNALAPLIERGTAPRVLGR